MAVTMNPETGTAAPQAERTVFRRPRLTTGFWSWITTSDHKKIGIMYGYTAFFFFIAGGIEALLLRIQLAGPDGAFLSAAEYNGLFTTHAVTMIFLFVMPMGAAFFNYLLPLMIGARDVAFPRMNAVSFWIFLFGGIFIYSSLLLAPPRPRWAATFRAGLWTPRPSVPYPTADGSFTPPTAAPSSPPAPLWTSPPSDCRSWGWPP